MLDRESAVAAIAPRSAIPAGAHHEPRHGLQHARLDGSAVLSPADLVAVVSALTDSAQHLPARLSGHCAACAPPQPAEPGRRAEEHDITGLSDIIRNSHSEPAPYDPDRRHAEADLRAFTEAARWPPTVHNMQNFEIIIIIDDKTTAMCPRQAARARHLTVLQRCT